MTRRAGGGRPDDQCGAAAVEFALVLPILVLLVFGVIEFGRAYHARSTLAHAARQGVRVAALDTGDPVASTEQAAAADHAASHSHRPPTQSPFSEQSRALVHGSPKGIGTQRSMSSSQR